MSTTLLELTRESHEEVERLERLIAKDLQAAPPAARDRLYQGHRVANMMERSTESTNKLIEIYEDEDGSRRDNILALGGAGHQANFSGTSRVFSAFYDRLKAIHEYHRRHPAAAGAVVDANGDSYLDVFSQPKKISISRKLKFVRLYGEYLQKLLEYLVYFLERTEPLQDIDRMFSKVIADFEEQCTTGNIEGWQTGNQENGHALIDLDNFLTAEELMELVPEKLKEALAALGLKTGGTVREQAERLFLTKYTPLEKLDRKHFVLKRRRGLEHVGGIVPDPLRPGEDAKELALMEAKVKKLCELLDETITRTKENVVRKQGLRYEDMEAELEEEEMGEEPGSDDEVLS